MSDDVPDRVKAYVQQVLLNLAREACRGRRTRDEIVYALRQLGLKRESAQAFLEALESKFDLKKSLDRNEEDALLRRLPAIVEANYHD